MPEEAADFQTKEDSSIDEITSRLIARIQSGKNIVMACEQSLLAALTVEKKTLKEWGEKFRVLLPEDPDDLLGLERAQSQVSNNIQEAEYILAMFEMRARAIRDFHDSDFATKYVMEMELNEGKKIAAEKIRQKVMVDPSVDSVLSASQAAEIIAEFFKKQVKALEEARKGIENRTKLMTLRLKLSSMQ